MSMLSVAVNRARAARAVVVTPPVEIYLWTPIKHYDLKTIVSNLLFYDDHCPQSVNTCEPIAPGIQRPSIEGIKRLIRATYSVTEAELIGQGKQASVVRVRMMACYLCCRHTMSSTPVIGRHFGNRDHTTIISARDRIAERRLSNEALNHELLKLEARIATA